MNYLVILLLVVSLLLIIGVYYKLSSPPIDCKVSSDLTWSQCSPTGFRTGTRYIEQEPKYGGMACPSDIIKPCYSILERILTDPIINDRWDIWMIDWSKKYYNINVNRIYDFVTKLPKGNFHMLILTYLIKENVSENIKKDFVVSYMLINRQLLIPINDFYVNDPDIYIEYNKQLQQIIFKRDNDILYTMDYYNFVDINYRNQLTLFDDFNNFFNIYINSQESYKKALLDKPNFKTDMAYILARGRNDAIELYNSNPNLFKEIFIQSKV